MTVKYPIWINKIEGAAQTPEEMNGIVEVLQNHAETLSLHDIRILAASSGIYTDALTPTSEVPTEVGDKVFLVTQPGTYTNFGNVVLPENNFGFIFKNGNSFSIQSVKLPTIPIKGKVEKGNTQAVSGGETFLAIALNKNNYFEQLFFAEDLYGNNTTLEGVGTQNVDFSWEENNGNFKFGGNYLKLTPTTNIVLVGSVFGVKIPEKYKNTNGKIRFYISYKSLNTIQFRLYFKDMNGNWLNNLSAPLIILEPSETENIVYIERDYEPNANSCELYISAIAGGSEVNLSLINAVYVGGLINGQVPEYNTTVINIPSGGVDLLRTALNNITDASETNRYLILLEEGVYDEIDIKGTNYQGNNKDVVIVRGAGIGKTLIRTDGLSTRLAPSNYNYPGNWAGYTIDQIPTVAKHTFYIQETITFEDLTAYANDVKYTLHQDNTNKTYKSLFKRCHLIHEEYNSDYLYVIGIGAKSFQFQEFEDVICELRTDRDLVLKDNGGIYWHNWNNRTAECGLKVNGLHAVGCNIAYIGDLCSNQPDRIELNNMTTTLPYGSLGFYLDPNYYTPTPPTIKDYPYSIQITMNNVFAKYVKWNNRPNIGVNGTVYNDYHVSVKNNSGTIISKGKGVIYNYSLNTIQEASGNSFDFITFQDIEPNTFGLVVGKKKAVDAILETGSYLSNDMLKFENGIFKKTTDLNDCVATCLSNSNGGLQIILLK